MYRKYNYKYDKIKKKNVYLFNGYKSSFYSLLCITMLVYRNLRVIII